MRAKWEDYVAKHQQYQDSYSATNKWLNDVTKKLAQCIDAGVDRSEIEDSQTRIQVLAVNSVNAPTELENLNWNKL